MWGESRMNRNEFLEKLKDDLSSFSDEERVSALKYYEEYFAEADVERADEVMAELVSPEDLAHRIERELKVLTELEHEPESVSKSAVEEFEKDVENVLNVSREEKIPELILELELDELEVLEEIKEEEKIEEVYEIKLETPVYHEEKLQNHKKNREKSGDSALKMILILCTAPIWLPLLIALASTVFGLVMTVFGIAFAVAALAISGFIMAGTGFLSIGYGIVNIFIDASSALYPIGTGFITAGLGIIMAYGFTKLTVLMFKSQFKFISWTVRGISNKFARKSA